MNFIKTILKKLLQKSYEVILIYWKNNKLTVQILTQVNRLRKLRYKK